MDVPADTEQPRSEMTVTQVTRRVKDQVEGAPDLADIWVRGETSNVRLPSSGHLYFTLKDEGAELRVAYFRFSAGKRKPPADGDALLVHGDVRVYEKRGEYQLVADDLLRAGVGDFAARFEALKRKLQDEGLFGDERKAALPAVPRRIAVITGPATAALRDVLSILERRAPYASVVLFPTAVQGEAAAGGIAEALRAADLCPGVEVILLVRGGGSIEDLWCFNEEDLARVLADVERPVITGIGHEIDFTIADFVADRRAPTPSAAAELTAPDVAELRGGLADQRGHLVRILADALADMRQELARVFDYRLLRDVVGIIEARGQQMDGWIQVLVGEMLEATHLGEELGFEDELSRLARSLDREIGDRVHDVSRLRVNLCHAGRVSLECVRSRLEAKGSELKARDPRAPKQLGYALVWDRTGKLVRDAEDVEVGDSLRIEVQRGEMDVERR